VNRLKGKVALITGAARGIGAGIARRISEEGATVIRTDLTADGGGWKLDVADEGDWQSAATRIGDEHGRLDILVNNAGIESSTLITDLSLDEWRRVMTINSDGTFIGCKTMLPLLAAAGEVGNHSSVINISSMLSRVAAPGQLAYSVSKAAIAHFTKCFAVECSALGYRVRANSVHPAVIDTPLLREQLMSQDAIPGATIEERLEAISQTSPLRMNGNPDDIAWACVYLASDESRFVNALEFLVDGGCVPAWR
jgi:NAD(P)-dependent dehydrogenase (short-subunit alcohol dehydrogenase family)